MRHAVNGSNSCFRKCISEQFLGYRQCGKSLSLDEIRKFYERELRQFLKGFEDTLRLNIILCMECFSGLFFFEDILFLEDIRRS